MEESNGLRLIQMKWNNKWHTIKIMSVAINHDINNKIIVVGACEYSTFIAFIENLNEFYG